MWFFWFLLHLAAANNNNNLLEECAKYYHPPNYMEQISKFKMPYMNHVSMPFNIIKPSPVRITKVLTVKTKYVYKNPICVKYTGKQKLCGNNNNNNEYLMSGNFNNNHNNKKILTKHNFWKNNNQFLDEKIETGINVLSKEEPTTMNEAETFTLKVSFDKLEPSEEYRSFSSHQLKTPQINHQQKIQEILIEDRLDQLETILPNYSRKRNFQTSTMYITKTLTNKRAMATLLVKNCIPVGYDVCTKKKSNTRRKSKLAKTTNNPEEEKFYFG